MSEPKLAAVLIAASTGIAALIAWPRAVLAAAVIIGVTAWYNWLAWGRHQPRK